MNETVAFLRSTYSPKLAILIENTILHFKISNIVFLYLKNIIETYNEDS